MTTGVKSKRRDFGFEIAFFLQFLVTSLCVLSITMDTTKQSLLVPTSTTKNTRHCLLHITPPLANILSLLPPRRKVEYKLLS